MKVKIRPACLLPADRWTPPTGEEVREILRLCELTGSRAARVLGLGLGGDRTVRRWIGEDSPIPYSAWAIFCELAGLGMIWRMPGPELVRPTTSHTGEGFANADIAPSHIPVGKIKSFGPCGPKYEVGQVLRRLEDGDWMIEITMVETGEKAEYRLTKLSDDPEAN